MDPNVQKPATDPVDSGNLDNQAAPQPDQVENASPPSTFPNLFINNSTGQADNQSQSIFDSSSRHQTNQEEPTQPMSSAQQYQPLEPAQPLQQSKQAEQFQKTEPIEPAQSPIQPQPTQYEDPQAQPQPPYEDPPIQPQPAQYEPNQDDPSQYQVPDQQGWWQTPLQPQPEFLYLEWLADSRVTTKRTPQYYSSLAVIVLLVSLILFFAGQTLLIFVVWAFLFISYVLSTVKAEDTAHQITSYGIRYRGEKLYYWEQLGRFWVRDNRGHLELHVEAPTHFGNELILLPANERSPDPVSVQDMIEVLSVYLIYEEPIPSQLDRWVLWLQDKFPLE